MTSLNSQQLKEQLQDLIKVSDFLVNNLDEKKIEQLIGFFEILIKWNKTYNLTNITNHQDILIKHFIDSLLLAEHIKDQDEFADVGTGAGFPGVPLAIIFPDKKFHLIDTLGKRIIFLNYLKSQLKLDNIFPIKARVEELDTTYNNVICRAFAPISKIFELTSNLVDQGNFYFMKANLEHEQLEFAQFELLNEIDLSSNFNQLLNSKLGKRLLLIYSKKS